ncbi:DUF2079 domain-containing protein [Streptomyces sp. NPDC087440]|uniref:DUF2079 domain-containing protein n=1 Tax=Streptomyces sp. NPDC087440 TaxID=3365790 RepID=UPI0037F5BF1E
MPTPSPRPAPTRETAPAAPHPTTSRPAPSWGATLAAPPDRPSAPTRALHALRAAARSGAAALTAPTPRTPGHTPSGTAPAPGAAPTSARPAPPTRLPRTPRPYAAALALLAFAVYAAYALRMHASFRTTGYDLGIFGQAIRSYAQLALPVSEIRATTGPDPDAPFPLLGDHFHPLLAVLAPLYRLLPHVETLLVAQAALVAWSVYVVTRAGGRRIGVAYALAWGVQKLIGFDFHEVALALPLLALSLAAYRAGRWRACAAWGAGLVLVKEDLGATVLVLGLLLLRHDRRAGTALCVLGPAAAAFAVLLVLPHFNPVGDYTYLSSMGGGTAPGDADLGAPTGLDTKATTLLVLLLPTLFLALRSPMILLVLPTLAWRFMSSNPSYWGTDYHYSTVLMPIVFFALIDALDRRPRPVPHLRTAVLTVAVLLATALPLAEALRPAFWQDPPRASAARQALARVPDGAKVAATNRLAPHLTDRATVYLHSPGSPDAKVDWMVLDTTDTTFSADPPSPTRPGFHQVYASQGYVVLRRT